MAISLDRIAVEEAGANPVRLARAIHKQLPDLAGAVPVHEIARALDIEEIREERLTSFEGCLLTDRRKSYGAILVNAANSLRRRRYTVGHELCHFLNERHIPTTEDGFRCTKGAIKYFRSSEHAERGFCEACGSSLVQRPLDGDWFAVATGCLDDSEEFPPNEHCGIESQVSWLKIDDQLPRSTTLDHMGYTVEEQP